MENLDLTITPFCQRPGENCKTLGDGFCVYCNEQVVICQGGCNTCITHRHAFTWIRHDAYGICTGYYCDTCYEDPDKYTYRKDRYEHDDAPLDED